VNRPDPGATKDQWRTWARSVRPALARDDLSRAIVDHLVAWPVLRAAHTVLLYIPMDDEMDPTPLLETDLPCRFVATRTPERGGDLTVHELGGPLQVHRLGFLQPHRLASEVSPGDVDVFLVPGLVFDSHGGRLGWGAAYFDRLLPAARHDARLVGVVPSALVVDRLPVTPTDVPMTHLATEDGIVAVEG
jgi:5-formyltetrahydrofolate cyclo-ligase